MKSLLVSAAAITASLAAAPAMAQSGDLSGLPVVLSEIAAPARALGRDDAPVRIDFYSSFNCVECADWYLNVLPELRTRYIDTGEARFEFHDVALEPIQPSVRAAMIGLCAEPARFFDVAQSFMSGQAAVLEDESRVTQWYADAVAVAGSDPARIEACAMSEATYDRVVAQTSDPAAGAFRAFPGIAVNNRIVEDVTLEGVAAAIVAAQAARSE